jgi:hypothetical protein
MLMSTAKRLWCAIVVILAGCGASDDHPEDTRPPEPPPEGKPWRRYLSRTEPLSVAEVTDIWETTSKAYAREVAERRSDVPANLFFLEAMDELGLRAGPGLVGLAKSLCEQSILIALAGMDRRHGTRFYLELLLADDTSPPARLTAAAQDMCDPPLLDELERLAEDTKQPEKTRTGAAKVAKQMLVWQLDDPRLASAAKNGVRARLQKPVYRNVRATAEW